MSLIYQKMLEDRFYLYRSGAPICKAIEAYALSQIEFERPILDVGWKQCQN